MTRNYQAYGLRFSSDIALPFAEADDGPVNVRIAEGPVTMDRPEGDQPGSTRFRNWEAEPGRFCIQLYGSCTALITGGDTITYTPEPGADTAQIVSQLIGSGLAALVMQRDILPMHSCSVQTKKGAVIVFGQSGAGKSTMLGGLLQHDLAMLADDVTAVRFAQDGRAMASPAFPATRLWRDSLAALGQSETGLDRVREDMAKFYLPVSRFCDEPQPVYGLVWLSAGNNDEPHICEVPSAERVPLVSHYVFRKKFLAGLEKRRMAFATVGALVRGARVIQVKRPSGFIAPRELAGQVLDALDAA